MILKPDDKYLKQVELEYSTSLEKYHNACNSINNLKTIISILVSIFGIIVSLVSPIVFDEEQFMSFFSIEPELYATILPLLSLSIILMIGGCLTIFCMLLLDRSSHLFDRYINISKMKYYTIITQYKKINKKLSDITQTISYKHEIYAWVIILLIISIFVMSTLTLLFLNGLGTGDGLINIILTQSLSDILVIPTIPILIWLMITLSIIFNIVGFSSLLYFYSNLLRINNIEYKLCLISCVVSFVLCITLPISVYVINLCPEIGSLVAYHALFLMGVPYIAQLVLVFYRFGYSICKLIKNKTKCKL